MKKKIFLSIVVTNIILQIIVQIFRSFIIWNIYNPIQWIIDIPTYTSDVRGGILSAFLIFWLCSVAVFHVVYSEIEEKKKHKIKKHESNIDQKTHDVWKSKLSINSIKQWL